VTHSTNAIRTVIVRNPDGMNMRGCASVAELASEFNAEMEIIGGAQRVNAGDMLQMLGLAAEAGTELQLEATGQDAEELADALVQLFEDKFGQEA